MPYESQPSKGGTRPTKGGTRPTKGGVRPTMEEKDVPVQDRPEEKAAPAPRTYVVQSGDSLWKIAQALLGDGNRWPEIFEANKDKIKDPNLIHPGQELVIPG